MTVWWLLLGSWKHAQRSFVGSWPCLLGCQGKHRPAAIRSEGPLTLTPPPPCLTHYNPAGPTPIAGNINILAEEDPSGQRPATAAEQALSAQLQEGRERAHQAKTQAEQQQQHAAAAPAARQQQQQQPQRCDEAMPDANAPAEGEAAAGSSREAQGGAAAQQAPAAGADRPAPHAGASCGIVSPTNPNSCVYGWQGQHCDFSYAAPPRGCMHNPSLPRTSREGGEVILYFF